jgi:hypothetical protein
LTGINVQPRSARLTAHTLGVDQVGGGLPGQGDRVDGGLGRVLRVYPAQSCSPVVPTAHVRPWAYGNEGAGSGFRGAGYQSSMISGRGWTAVLVRGMLPYRGQRRSFAASQPTTGIAARTAINADITRGLRCGSRFLALLIFCKPTTPHHGSCHRSYRGIHLFSGQGH